MCWARFRRRSAPHSKRCLRTTKRGAAAVKLGSGGLRRSGDVDRRRRAARAIVWQRSKGRCRGRLPSARSDDATCSVAARRALLRRSRDRWRRATYALGALAAGLQPCRRGEVLFTRRGKLQGSLCRRGQSRRRSARAHHPRRSRNPHRFRAPGRGRGAARPQPRTLVHRARQAAEIHGPRR